MTDLVTALTLLTSAYAAIVLAFTTLLHLANGLRLLSSHPRGARLFLVRGAWYGVGSAVATTVFQALIDN